MKKDKKITKIMSMFFILILVVATLSFSLNTKEVSASDSVVITRDVGEIEESKLPTQMNFNVVIDIDQVTNENVVTKIKSVSILLNCKSQFRISLTRKSYNQVDQAEYIGYYKFQKTDMPSLGGSCTAQAIVSFQDDHKIESVISTIPISFAAPSTQTGTEQGSSGSNLGSQVGKVLSGVVVQASTTAVNNAVGKLGLKLGQSTTMAVQTQLVEQGKTELTEQQIKAQQARALAKIERNARLELPWVKGLDLFFGGLSVAYGVWMGIALGSKTGNCAPEQPLTTDRCEACNAPGMLCTESRCGILGNNCHAVPTEDANNLLCLKAECVSQGSPKVNLIKVSAYIDNRTGGEAGPVRGIDNVTVWNGREPVAIGTDVPYNVTTLYLDVQATANTKPADASKKTICKWSFEQGKDIEEMNPFDPDLFEDSHLGIIDLQGLATDQEHTIYIKCKDICGAKPTAQDYSAYFKFRLGKEPDFTAPCYPDMESAYDDGRCYIDPWNVYLPADLPKVNAQFWTNKPGECKYSLATDNFTTVWNDMRAFTNHSDPMILDGSCISGKCLRTNSTDCKHCNLMLDLTKGEQINLNISEELLRKSNLSEQEIQEVLNLSGQFQQIGEVGLFRLMVVCRNVNNIEMEPFLYSILTMPPYQVIISKPNQSDPDYDKYELHQPILVNTTHNTQCKYEVFLSNRPNPNTRWENLTFIDEEFNIFHEGQIIQNLTAPATYKLRAVCRDEGRLQVENITTFTLDKDLDDPFVVRLFHINNPDFGAFGNSLVIETNENAECVYGLNSCNYNFSLANSMSTADGYTHSAIWQTNNTYYIKCKDKWNNYPDFPGQNRPNSPVCTIEINPYEVPELPL